MSTLIKLAHNGLMSCIVVVGVTHENGAILVVLLVRPGAPKGYWDWSKSFWISEDFIIGKANNKCDATKQPIVVIRCPLDKRTRTL